MDRRRYLSLLAFRVALMVLALLTAARALHEQGGGAKPWFLAALFAISAALLQILPVVVPTGRGRSVVYSLGSAFFLAGMFLLPPGPLVITVTFAVALSGLVVATRPYRLVVQLSVAVLSYAGVALLLHLGPHADDPVTPTLERSAVEFLIMAGAVVSQLLFRSVALRIERGDATPHWGAFQRDALIEGSLALALGTTITVLVRNHVAYLGLVYAQVGATWWFLHRYRVHVRKLEGSAVPVAERREIAA
jgi:hypothetical protein